jgi:nucleoside phosphorylase
MNPAAGLLVALHAERRALERRLRDARRAQMDGRPVAFGNLAGQPVVLIQAGLGPERARAAGRLAVGRLDCRSLWSLGLAGGLDPALRTGDLVLAERVGTPDHLAPGRPAAAAVAASLPGIAMHVGAIISVDAPACTPEEKAALRRSSRALVVDMEAAGVAEAAEAAGVPWLAFKAVLDPADMAVPPALLAAAGPAGNLCPAALLRSLCRPGSLAAAWTLGRRSRAALRRLADALEPALRAWLALTPPDRSAKMQP